MCLVLSLMLSMCTDGDTCCLVISIKKGCHIIMEIMVHLVFELNGAIAAQHQSTCCLVMSNINGCYSTLGDADKIDADHDKL